MPADSNARHIRRARLARILSSLFVLSILMGTGPGILLVNRPDSVFGIPQVYAWGILWYLVQVAIALIAYFALWHDSPDDDTQPVRDSEQGGSR